MADALETNIVRSLSLIFFEIVPPSLQTHCILTSSISRHVLRNFNIQADLRPCQLWHVTPGTNHIIGFVGQESPGRWDGHVVCTTQSHLIDTAVRGLHRDFQLEVPPVIMAATIKLPTQMIARRDLDDKRRIWWINPPDGADPTIPGERQDVIETYAGGLTTALEKTLGIKRRNGDGDQRAA